jgi:hypothetical protein
LRKVKAQIDEVAAGADAEAIYAQTATLVREGARISRRAFDRIEALTPPGDDREAVDAWVAANRRQAVRTDELAKAFAAQDQTRIAELSEEVDALDATNNAAAAELGMRTCAERVA